MVAYVRDGWQDDILGPDWEALTLRLKPDYEGDAVATLVRNRLPEHEATTPPQPAVLYVHGFTDYFFQVHHAAAWIARGYRFYALDLRKYGRSLRAGQTPNFCFDLAEYYEELDLALALLRADAPVRRVVVLGHSAGGLLAPLWLDARQRRGLGGVDGLVLNSAWLELQGTWFDRGPLTQIVRVAASLLPRMPAQREGQLAYGRSIHRSTGGEWDFDLRLKPLGGFPPLLAWLRAIRAGQRRVREGLDLDAPVLALTSDRSVPAARAEPDCDIVLELPTIARYISRLGRETTHVEVAGGLHDLSLSRQPVRERYVREILDWLDHRGL
ncbi:alpha/beta hydrolase [Micrococcales bacterium 31B]|nr:alpha/beta hydrolase [Micrococcales bacterium 31B]